MITNNFGSALNSIFLPHLSILKMAGIVYHFYYKNKNKLLKRALYLLLTAESICVITAQTIDLLFYNFSVFLSLPLALICAWLDYHYFIIVINFFIIKAITNYIIMKG